MCLSRKREHVRCGFDLLACESTLGRDRNAAIVGVGNGCNGAVEGAAAQQRLELRALPRGQCTTCSRAGLPSRAHRQPQGVARIDEVRILDVRVDVPDLRPQPGIAQEHGGDAPQRVAALDGVGLGRARVDRRRRSRSRPSCCHGLVGRRSGTDWVTVAGSGPVQSHSGVRRLPRPGRLDGGGCASSWDESIESSRQGQIRAPAARQADEPARNAGVTDCLIKEHPSLLVTGPGGPWPTPAVINSVGP